MKYHNQVFFYVPCMPTNSILQFNAYCLHFAELEKKFVELFLGFFFPFSLFYMRKLVFSEKEISLEFKQNLDETHIHV